MVSPAQVPFNPNRGRLSRPENFQPVLPEYPVQYDDQTIQIPIQSNVMYPSGNYAPQAPAPNHYQPYWQPNQAPLPPHNRNERDGKKSRTALAATIGGVVASLITTGVVLAATKGSDKEAPLNPGVTNSQDHNTTTDHNRPTEEADLQPISLYNRDITGEDYRKVLDLVLPFLEEHRQDSLDTLNAMTRPLVNSSIDNRLESDDQREMQRELNNRSADLYTASTQKNPILAGNLLAGIFRPGSMQYTLYEDKVKSGDPVIMRMLVREVSAPASHGTIAGFPMNGRETRLVKVLDMIHPEIEDWVVTKVTNQYEDHSSQVVMDVITGSSPYFVMDVTNWTPGK